MSPFEGHGGGSLLEHFHVSDSEHWVVIKWKKHGHVAEPVRVAVLRSEQGFADKAEEALEGEVRPTVYLRGCRRSVWTRTWWAT